MGWAALIHHTTWDEAHRIAELYDLACVSCRQFERQTGEWQAKPIVTRRKIGKYWYNYFEDNRYKRTLVEHADGREPANYAPCFYLPDKIRYIDLLSYLYQNMWQFKGVYHPYLLYYTRNRDEVIYSVYKGIMHIPLEVSINNPLLYFVMGMPNSRNSTKYRKLEG